MKNIILVTFLLISLNIFSQTSTEKWSSLNNRYEYFDSSGYMTGYKEYNSLMGTWDYYSEKQRPRQNQYNPIVNPINENFQGKSNVVINGLAYTHPISGINFKLQLLISQKHKQFDTLYHQYAQDLNPHS